MLALDTIDFRSRMAAARLVNASGETLVGGEFPFAEEDTTIVNIRQAVRPQLLALRDAHAAELGRLVTEVGAVDAT